MIIFRESPNNGPEVKNKKVFHEYLCDWEGEGGDPFLEIPHIYFKTPLKQRGGLKTIINSLNYTKCIPQSF